MKNAQKDKYYKEARKWLESLYNGLSKTGQEDAILKEFLNGFLYAGIITDIVTQDELEAFIDEINQEVFGMTLAERKNKKRLEADLEKDFEIPTFERQGIKLNL